MVMDLINKIEHTTIKGIADITGLSIVERTLYGEPRKILVTEGINMLGIYKLQKIIPEIDYNRITTDNSHVNETIFGISIARTFIQSDLKRIFNVNHSHISMFVDASIYKRQIKERDVFN